MKILLVSGSRNAHGQTAQAAEAALKGAARAGATVERAWLPALKVERCRQCEDDGWGICRKEGQCVVEDDFHALVEKVRRADAVLFATPVYFSDLSESLRAFLDRLRRTCRHEEGKRRIVGKPAMGLCVAGGGGGGAPACCLSLERVLATCGFDVVDMIPVRRQNLPAKRPSLEEAGEWLASASSSVDPAPAR